MLGSSAVNQHRLWMLLCLSCLLSRELQEGAVGAGGGCLLETSPADSLGGLLGGDDAVWLLIKQPWRSLLAGLCSSFPCFFTRMPDSRKQEEKV